MMKTSSVISIITFSLVITAITSGTNTCNMDTYSRETVIDRFRDRATMFRPCTAESFETRTLAPLFIDSETSLQSFVASEGLPGSGTSYDPYIIEGYIFDSIRIDHVESHVLLRNNVFRPTTANSDPFFGIAFHFRYVSHVNVENNTVESINSYGSIYPLIQVVRSSDIWITGNTVIAAPNLLGIRVVESYDIYITNNMLDFSFNDQSAVILYNNNHVQFSGNYLNYSWYVEDYGLEVENCKNLVITDNTLNDSDIYISTGDRVDITNNIIDKDLITENSRHVKIVNNTCHFNIKMKQVDEITVENNTVDYNLEIIMSSNGKVSGNVVKNLIIEDCQQITSTANKIISKKSVTSAGISTVIITLIGLFSLNRKRH
ncbi:MAG: right-handed parallel beta-helix repeat-containing protein [Candidatus Odinarchaeota archaeon]